MNTKEDLRAQFKKIRESMPPSERKSASRKIAAQFFDILEFQGARAVGVYLSKGDEVDTLLIVKKLLAKKTTVAAPKVVGTNLEFFQIKSLKDCAPGSFGVLEPGPKCKKIDPRILDLLLVPGLVFDAQGYRLGYGKGFYDKFLSRNKIFNSIGLTYDTNTAKEIPHETTDVPVTWVLTETKTSCITHEDPEGK